MKEELISFETAKLAKEKGFDWRAKPYYDDKGKLNESSVFVKNSFWGQKDDYCVASTQSLLQKWLREEKKIFIQVEYKRFGLKSEAKSFYKYIVGAWDLKTNFYKQLHVKTKHTYEEALEEGLKEALKLIIKNKTK